MKHYFQFLPDAPPDLITRGARIAQLKEEVNQLYARQVKMEELIANLETQTEDEIKSGWTEEEIIEAKRQALLKSAA